MEVKTSELSGIQLEIAVSMAVRGLKTKHPQPLTWAYCGPIIEQNKICLDEYNGWLATIKGPPFHQTAVARETGQTPLIAAMRCFVASIFGKSIDI